MSVITRIEITHHQLPLDPPFPASWDTQPRTKFPATIVRVHDDEGRVGIGSGDAMYGFADYERYFIGHDPLDLDRHAAVLANIEFHAGRPWPMDIALWDLAGKAAGQPLWRLLGGSPTESMPCYASLLRYGEAAQVGAACERAIGLGYRDIKLHEITVPEIAAARKAIGPDARLMVDTNCPWTVWEAIDMARRVEEYDLTWFEEPVWPPGDHDGLARVRAEGGVPIAAGENAAGLHDFRVAFETEALDVAQPSVIKIGGPSAMIEIAALARAFGVRVVPHNAYFGAGYLASLHCNAALAPDAPFERLFLDLEASPYHDLVVAENGRVAVPDGPGLGRDPDMAVLRKYLVGDAGIHRA